MALWILIGATLFGVVYTSAGAQDMVMDFVQGIGLNRWFTPMLRSSFINDKIFDLASLLN